MANRPIFPNEIKNAALDIEPADTTTTQSLITAGAGGSRINNISVTSDDTSDVILNVFYYDGVTDYLIGAVTIPTLSGTDGTILPVSLFTQELMPFLGDDLSYYLEATDSIRVAAQSTVTTAKKISLVVTYGDY